MDCCSQTSAIDAYFDERKARREADQYLREGLAAHAKVMLAAVSSPGVQEASVLEIGGGIGGLQIELLQRGAAHATNVDASTAYLTAAQTLAERLGLAERMRYHHGDFTLDAGSIPVADIVILHRVVCCYPDMPRLVSAAARHACQRLALSFPRDTWYMRLTIEAQALWMRMKGSSFRTYVHSPAAIFQVAAEAGLRPVHQAYSRPWQIVVFEP
jgi:2-polyprenyl-3-methyl-5-hydroxy-6-metoxy-1,4-benzoquinol methylase